MLFRLLCWRQRQRQQRGRWWRCTPAIALMVVIEFRYYSILGALCSLLPMKTFTHFHYIPLSFIFESTTLRWNIQKLQSKALNIQQERPMHLDFIQWLVIKWNLIWLFYDFTWTKPFREIEHQLIHIHLWVKVNKFT